MIGLATGAIFGLAPLLHLAPDATSLALKEGGTRTTAAAGRNRIRRALAAVEVALVIGAGLLLRTVMNLANVDSGFNRGQLVTFAVTLPNASYSKPEPVRTLYNRLLDRCDLPPGSEPSEDPALGSAAGPAHCRKALSGSRPTRWRHDR